MRKAKRLARALLLSACVQATAFAAPQQTTPRQQQPAAPAQAATAVAPAPSMTAEKWREDLRFMAAEMARRHKNLYHKTSRERFEAEVRRLDERIPALARHETVVGLMRLVALVGDGHTHMGLGQDPAAQFRQYPVRFYFFRDGLFVEAAAPEYRDAVGGRVLKIGRASAEEAYRAVREVTPHDSEMDAKFRAPFLMAVPEVLHAVGVTEDMERVPLVVERGRRQVTVELRPLARAGARDLEIPAGWTTAREAAQAPLYMKDALNNFWFEHLKDERALYVQYNAVADKRDETVADFFRRVFEFVEANAVERLIIDVRNNGGGNNFLNRAIVTGVIRADRINRRGRLFVITGRRTFSAAQNFVNEMEKYTNAIFVGEPTGASPNHYGDAARITLPNSGLTVRASTVWWQDADPRDTREWTAPHVAAELTSEDFRAGRDPALQAALSYAEGKSLADSMLESMGAGNMEAALKLYRAYRADPAHVYLSTEAEMNRLGYMLLREKRHAEAVEIFKLNVADYPASANTYDSLADAYEAAGQKELAIEFSEKTLAALPADRGTDFFKNGLRDSAQGRLRRLRGN
ncbi:MAG TPA: S41 family peptidase [Pyrinomonadaceae bacterium]|nr:S41 family peptidase [Pyrinomonadaceae bacterium]